MDLRTIKSFKAIVEYGSFQQAAEQLNYAQSTITSHIKKLENSLGVTLFERGNNLQLTNAGVLLNEKSELLLKSFENLQHSMDELIKGDAELIKIGVMEPMASYRLPALLSIFNKRYPEAQISLQIHGSKVLADMVMKDEIEMAICAAPTKSVGFQFEAIFSEKVVLLLPSDHPLSKKEVVHLEDLEDETLIMTNTYCPFRGNFEKKMLEKGLLPNYGMEVSNMLTLKYYVQSGFGPAIVPKIILDPPPEGTIIKRIANLQEGLTVGILRKANKEPSRRMNTLLEMMRSAAVYPV